MVDCKTIAPGQDFYGQDGHFGTDPLSFIDLGDGTVRDDRTGLVWSQATYGGMS